MSDPATFLQLVVAILCASVPPAALAGASLWRLQRVESEMKATVAKVAEHDRSIVALDRDAHAARNREQAMMQQLALMDEKVSDIRDVVIRIDERQSRDDTNPRKRGT